MRFHSIFQIIKYFWLAINLLRENYLILLRENKINEETLKDRADYPLEQMKDVNINLYQQNYISLDKACFKSKFKQNTNFNSFLIKLKNAVKYQNLEKFAKLIYLLN